MYVFTCVWLFVTPRSVAHQAPLCMEFSRQGYWRGLLFPTPGDLPNPRIEPMLLASPTLAGRDSLPLGSPYDHLQPQTNPLSPSSIYLLPLSSFCQNKWIWKTIKEASKCSQSTRCQYETSKFFFIKISILFLFFSFALVWWKFTQVWVCDVLN